MEKEWTKGVPECTCKVCKQVILRKDGEDKVKCGNKDCSEFDKLKDYSEINMGICIVEMKPDRSKYF